MQPVVHKVQDSAGGTCKVCVPGTIPSIVTLLIDNGRASHEWEQVTCTECLALRSGADRMPERAGAAT